ncbi:MAG TPA: hypothetical protein VFG33_29690 [Kribbella sp.]|uniref:hypothetical protein n=1 Tax=Kribbella sp. TaxID=1871183 RepID=UPI002D79B457|nr:hypothetical protein [Kribbella sp.]HET6297594.1 hypothetical protein [Kribbella sp.]
MSRFSRAALTAVVVVLALAPVTGATQCTDPGECVNTLSTFWNLPLGSSEPLAWIPALLLAGVAAVFVFRRSKKKKRT